MGQSALKYKRYKNTSSVQRKPIFINHAINSTETTIGHLGTGIGTSAEHLLSGILKGPFQALINSLIVIAIIILSLYIILVYGIPKLTTATNTRTFSGVKIQTPGTNDSFESINLDIQIYLTQRIYNMRQTQTWIPHNQSVSDAKVTPKTQQI